VDEEGPEGAVPRLGGSPVRILGGGEHLSCVYIVLCKMSFHVFFFTSTLVLPWGRGEQDRKWGGGRWILKGRMGMTDNAAVPGLTLSIG
jgi:hypothetical protein